MTTALEGLKVLDVTRNMPGPWAAMILGDLGADVIKVEDPETGDPVRYVSLDAGGTGGVFALLNRNKRSLAVDLKRPEGISILRDLARASDVILDGFRPGVLDRLGVGYGALRALQPRLIFCAISGYGADGPLRERSGHDLNYLSLAGVTGLQVDDAKKPVLSPVQVSDLGASLFAAVGVLAALAARERTGEGQYVDISMMEAAMALMLTPAAGLFAGAEVRLGERLPLTGLLACYNVYRTADQRYLSVAALEPKFWRRFCEAIDREDLLLLHYQPEEQASLKEAIAQEIASKSLAEWIEVFRNEDACVEPVLAVQEAFESAQARHRKVIVDAARQGGEAEKQLGLPIRLSATPAQIRRSAPRHGEQTREILAEIGYSEATIAGLEARGVIAC